jgi:pyruvate,water dikinase
LKRTVLDNSNIVESYPGLTLPLSYSFIQIAYSGVFKGIIGANLRDDETLDKYAYVFRNMIDIYNGRVYYNINNWYSILDFLPFSKRITPIWQDMMGVKEREIIAEPLHKFSRLKKAALSLRIIRSFFHVTRDMTRLEKDFLAAGNHFNQSWREDLTIEELIALFHDLERMILNKWHVTLMNDMYAFVWTGLLKRKMTRRGVDIAASISNISGIESLKPVKALLHLAKDYGDRENLLSIPEVKEYLDLYGDRYAEELKLESDTFRECPALLEEQIRIYAADKDKLSSMIESLEGTNPILANGIIAKRAKIGIKNREISRLNRSRLYGMVRRIFKSIGRQVFGDKWRDIFYLTVDEIFAHRFDLGLIESRKREYAKYAQLPVCNRIILQDGVPVDSMQSVSDNQTGGNTVIHDEVPVDSVANSVTSAALTGTGTSPGCVMGQAVVLTYPDIDTDVTDKIIVTKTTDPGWVFLMCRAKAIVAEKGSIMSHTSIVARELGIPAVVGVENASGLIRTGDTLRVDADAGRVEIV